MNKLDKDYCDLLQDILDNGYKKGDRTGTGTLSVFGRQIRHKMSDGFPLLTTKKMYFKGIVTELLWFLRGETNIESLVKDDCHIWDGDAYKFYCTRNGDHVYVGSECLSCGKVSNHDTDYNDDSDACIHCGEYNVKWKHIYQENTLLTQEEFIEKIKTDDEFATKWGDLGPIYGKQWREWSKYDKTCPNMPYDFEYHSSHDGPIDQIQNIIDELKTNPDSRRLIVSAWNVGELDQMTLPPCHYAFQFYTRELSEDERYDLCSSKKTKMTAISEEDYIKYNIPTRTISLMWDQRSVDTFLGLPFNIASYGLLLEIVAKEVNMVPDELIGCLGDTHLYSNHIEQAREQIGRPLTFDERYELFKNRRGIQSDKTFEEDGGNALGKISVLDMMDDENIPTRTRKPFELPKININNVSKKSLFDGYDITDFELIGYQSHPTIKGELSN